jgi:hypothetical protein
MPEYEYDKSNHIHKELSDLSIKAHDIHHNKEKMKIIDKRLDELAIQLKNVFRMHSDSKKCRSFLALLFAAGYV